MFGTRIHRTETALIWAFAIALLLILCIALATIFATPPAQSQPSNPGLKTTYAQFFATAPTGACGTFTQMAFALDTGCSYKCATTWSLVSCGGSTFVCGSEAPGVNCTNGGYYCTTGGTTYYACNGDDGAPGAAGANGLDCWDADADGTEDAGEDTNSDSTWDAQDCQGPQGDPGLDGSDGAPGADGTDGLNCWDLDGDGTMDPAEDITGDSTWDAADCGASISGTAYTLPMYEADGTGLESSPFSVGDADYDSTYETLIIPYNSQVGRQYDYDSDGTDEYVYTVYANAGGSASTIMTTTCEPRKFMMSTLWDCSTEGDYSTNGGPQNTNPFHVTSARFTAPIDSAGYTGIQTRRVDTEGLQQLIWCSGSTDGSKRSAICQMSNTNWQMFGSSFGLDRETDGTWTYLADDFDGTNDRLYADYDNDGTKDVGENYLDETGGATGDAAADGTTKGIATFTAADFDDDGSGTISIDGNAWATRAAVPSLETDAAHDTCAEVTGCVENAITAAGVPAAETDAAHDACSEISGCVVGAYTASDAVADGTTKGIATFVAADFDSDGSGRIGLQDCAASQILKRNVGDDAWECATDLSGGTPDDAQADGTNKGIATFVASDFDSDGSGRISIDYSGGQEGDGTLDGFISAADWTTFNAKGVGDMTKAVYDSAADGTVDSAAYAANAGTWNGVVKGTMTDTKFCTYTASGTTINCASDAGAASDAVADGTTKGVATFVASDFDSDGSGRISIDDATWAKDAQAPTVIADSFDYDQDGTAETGKVIDPGDGYGMAGGSPFTSRVTFYEDFLNNAPKIFTCSACTASTPLVDADPQTTASMFGNTGLLATGTLGNDSVLGMMPFATFDGTYATYVADKMDHFAARVDISSATAGTRKMFGGLRVVTATDLTTKKDGIFFWCDPMSDMDGDGTVGDYDSDATATAHPDGDCADASEDADDCYWRVVAFNNATDNASIDGVTTNAYVVKTTTSCTSSSATIAAQTLELVRSGANYLAYVNGVLVTTLDSDIPADSRLLSLWGAWIEVRKATNRWWWIDWMYYSGRR